MNLLQSQSPHSLSLDEDKNLLDQMSQMIRLYCSSHIHLMSLPSKHSLLTHQSFLPRERLEMYIFELLFLDPR